MSSLAWAIIPARAARGSSLDAGSEAVVILSGLDELFPQLRGRFPIWPPPSTTPGRGSSARASLVGPGCETGAPVWVRGQEPAVQLSGIPRTTTQACNRNCGRS